MPDFINELQQKAALKLYEHVNLGPCYEGSLNEDIVHNTEIVAKELQTEVPEVSIEVIHAFPPSKEYIFADMSPDEKMEANGVYIAGWEEDRAYRLATLRQIGIRQVGLMTPSAIQKEHSAGDEVRYFMLSHEELLRLAMTALGDPVLETGIMNGTSTINAVTFELPAKDALHGKPEIFRSLELTGVLPKKYSSGDYEDKNNIIRFEGDYADKIMEIRERLGMTATKTALTHRQTGMTVITSEAPSPAEVPEEPALRAPAARLADVVPLFGDRARTDQQPEEEVRRR